MEANRLQSWARDEMEKKLEHLSLDYGVARLLTQAGQLGEAVLNQGDVEKELADVAFVVAMIANRCNVDIGRALEKHLYARSGEEFMARLDQR